MGQAVITCLDQMDQTGWKTLWETYKGQHKWPSVVLEHAPTPRSGKHNSDFL